MWRCGAEQAYRAGIELLPVPVITERQDMREVVAECGDTLVLGGESHLAGDSTFVRGKQIVVSGTHPSARPVVQPTNATQGRSERAGMDSGQEKAVTASWRKGSSAGQAQHEIQYGERDSIGDEELDSDRTRQPEHASLPGKDTPRHPRMGSSGTLPGMFQRVGRCSETVTSVRRVEIRRVERDLREGLSDLCWHIRETPLEGPVVYGAIDPAVRW
jgi:hypothetical protein